MELKQKSTRCVILLHEIYGVNQHMQVMATTLFEHGYDVYVPNMLRRNDPFTYEEEAEAYRYFMDEIGFVQAKEQITELIGHLALNYEHLRIVGFSIGATIAWLCSENPAIQKVIGFYGSRIRQYTEIKPTSSTYLIFGEREPSFQPADLMEALSLHTNVEVEIVDASHGFADPFSPNYDPAITKRVLSTIFD